MPKQQPQEEKPDRLWIELEIHPDASVNVRRADLATRMLRRLGDDISKFWWHEKDRRYCITIDSGGSYMTCADSGHWFRLEFLATGKH
jgi:hypothetical protein